MIRDADRAFVALVGVSLASSAILAVLFVSLLPHVGDPVPAVILFLATIGIVLGLTSLGRQLWGTLQLIRRLLHRRVASPERLTNIAEALAIGDRLDVVAEERPFAFTYWFARPRVCVSTGLIERLGDDEVRAVLSHERYHLARRDPLRIVLARYFAAALYVVPVVDDLVAHYAMLKEVAADADAVRAQGSVRPLARALYRLMPHADEMDLGLLTPVGGLTVTEARIDQLVAPQPIAAALPLGHVALSVMTLAGALALLVVQLPPAAGHFAVAFPWPPAAVISLAAIVGIAHHVRAVTRA